MFSNIRLKSGMVILIKIIFLLALFGFVEKRNYDKICQDILIDINAESENYFLKDVDINDIITERGKTDLVGGKLIHINLKDLEMRIKRNKFVEDVQVVKNHSGNLKVRVKQCKPIARVITPDSSYYISDKGKVLPMSKRYTAYVMLVFGDGTKQLFNNPNAWTPMDSSFFSFIKYIHQDPFLQAQVADISVDKRLNINIYPQVTKQVIEFGKPEQLVDKFKKMSILYKEILPGAGWNTYSKVNLKFENQIICE